MTANRDLARLRGISEETCQYIDEVHRGLNNLLALWAGESWEEPRHKLIESTEFMLQELWGFEQDSAYHTWTKRYKFKTEWAGRVFRCTTTGECFTIPASVEERDFYQIGEGGVDVGRLNFYSRFIGNIEEIERNTQILKKEI